MADFILVEDLQNFKVLQTYINGELVAERGRSFVKSVEIELLNNFKTSKKQVSDFEIRSDASRIKVIEAFDGELITNEIEADPLIKDGKLISNIESDVLKLTVVNRYHNSDPAIAFIKTSDCKKELLRARWVMIHIILLLLVRQMKASVVP